MIVYETLYETIQANANTLLVCTHKYRIILNVVFHTVQQRDTEIIPDVPLVCVERGQHAHRGGHSQSCSFRVLHKCSDYSITQTSKLSGNVVLWFSQKNNGFMVHTLQGDSVSES